ncbi:TrbI/VirB10 family protein [Lysobacter fragariae]
MSQNTSSHPDGQADAYASAPPEAGQGYHASQNPYYAQQSAQTDLDAGAPVLRSDEVQKLNRKALVFLAGIAVLLLVVAYMMFSSAGSDDKKPAERKALVVPEAPKAIVEEAPPLPPADSDALPPLPETEVPPIALQPMSPASPQASASQSVSMEPQGPSLLERRMSNDAGGSGPFGGSRPDAAQQAVAQTQAMMALATQQAGGNGIAQDQADALPKVASAAPIFNPDTLLVRGTYIRCVMETRIVTDISGFTSCVVTEPVYSINGRRLLLPKGSKASGRYQGSTVNGPRVAVVWDRITTPNGIDINMASPGVDNLGGAGHPGQYDAHWASRITSALLISLISDGFKYAAAKNGPEGTVVTNSGSEVVMPYESNTARAMERLANQAIERSANRPATVTINQGSVVNIYVARDVSFSGVLR